MILVDFRTFLNGGDDFDRLHVGLGGKSVPETYQRTWEGHLISGVFDLETNVRGAAEIRERVHFIGFVEEQSCHRLYRRMLKLHPARWSTTTRNWQHEPTVELNPKHHKERKAA